VFLGVDQTLSLPPKAGLNLNLGFYQSDERGSKVGFQAFLISFVPPTISSVHWEKSSLHSHQLPSGGAWQGQSSHQAGDAEPETRR
jgi:hypothetical protein